MKNWPMIKVADEFDLQMGKTPARDNPAYWGGDQKWASIADIGRSDMCLADTKEAITQEAVSESGIKAVPPNTVVMSFKLSIGRTAITASRMYTNEAIMAFLPHDASAFDLHFLYHLFSNRNWSEGCNKAVKGVTLNKATLNAARIPKPDISEQRAVASTLDKICDLIATCDEQLVRLDQLVKSRFVEMFGDMSSTRFPIQTIGSIAKEIRYGTSRPAVEGGKYIYLRMNNVTQDGRVDLTNIKRISVPDSEVEKCIVRRGDILFNRTNSKELIGKTCMFDFDEPMIIAGYLIRVRLEDFVLPQYVSMFMNLPSMKSKLRYMAKGAVNQANISAEELKTIKLPIPPIALQREFAAFVAKVDKLAFAARQRRDVAKQLYRAKIQEFFG